MTLDGKGYSIGGWTTASIQDCDEYDPDVWTNKTSMLAPARFGVADMVIASVGYIAGGGLGPVGDTDEYDPDSWTSKTSVSPTRWSAVGMSMDDLGYICGGGPTLLVDTDEYDPDSWTGKTNMLAPARYYHASTSL